ncbi:hypothetical protein C8A05DRAFT_43223 [Staphylotrichum tortipilum]|uniref:3-carboxymuconate cyclase n=1 Tax=Staphylotrichum tortipilum TaxID=2831512 RepID=A0AAN6MPE1_9PEZI|nr:hypothetical protein C8A05DRAFT_43223 [Staphylotrichum longicolle]
MSFLRSPAFLLTAALVTFAPGAATTSYPRLSPRQNSTMAATAKALYFITNDATNAIVALPIGPDGKLSPGTVTQTGGAGSASLKSDGQPAAPDALVSQSALTIAGDAIFAVNAGSNTLSMLTICPSDPTRLTLVGQPAALPGEFPNTVGASAKNNLVCVGMTGARAGVSCARFSPDTGLGPMDALRPFDLGQTTPPVGPANTVSQVFFSADQSMLFATVKGNPAANKTGFFSSFPVEGPCRPRRGRRRSSLSQMTISPTETRSTPADTALLFGAQPVPGTANVFATDASFGAAVLSVDPASGAASTLARGEIEGQAATCWAALSARRGTAFVTDVARGRIVEMGVGDAGVVGVVEVGEGVQGMIDLRVGGDFVYALAPGDGSGEAAVVVVDVARERAAGMVQRFGLEGVAGKTAMGMAVLV